MAARMVSGVNESLEPLDAILAVCDRCGSSWLIVDGGDDEVAIGSSEAASQGTGASTGLGWCPVERA